MEQVKRNNYTMKQVEESEVEKKSNEKAVESKTENKPANGPFGMTKTKEPITNSYNLGCFSFVVL